ncbi:MAG: hypothetical protein WB239_03610 [Acidimicrobiia bacterium]
MTDSPSGAEIGCRSGFLAGMALLGWALAMGAVGLTMVLSDRCTGPCDGIGLSLFYAAAPISALFGVLGGGIPVAWPLDIGLWILAGIGAASWAGRLHRPLWRLLIGLGVSALVYGIIMARFVAVDPG